MKTYKVMWYNEDAYGPTDGWEVIIQADDETQAKENAICYLENIKAVMQIDDNYEVFICKELTEKILYCNRFNML